MKAVIAKTIEEYISSFPKDIQVILEELRQAIRNAAPGAEETISYRMPAFKQNGPLVYFAAFKDHIGFFPTSSAVEEFRDRLGCYQTSKGTIRFPYNETLPLNLIKDIVRFKVKENSEIQNFEAQSKQSKVN